MFEQRLDGNDLQTNKWYNSNINPYVANGYGQLQNNGNCTSYAWGRVSEIAEAPLQNCKGNAIDFAYSSSFEQVDTPEFGDVIVWGGNYYGHVAIVEEVYDNGDILISESSWGTEIFTTKKLEKNTNYSNGYGLYFIGFYEANIIKDARIKEEERIKQILLEKEKELNKEYEVTFTIQEVTPFDYIVTTEPLLLNVLAI